MELKVGLPKGSLQESTFKLFRRAGFQVSLQLRSPDPQSEYAKYRHVPILMLTAIHTTTSLRFGPDEAYLPVDDFVEKPIDPDVLLEKVQRLIGEAGKKA